MSAPRILLVDDEPEILEYLGLVFEDYDTESAADAESALARLRASAFDVLITDVRMPGGSGLDLIREAKKILPAIAVIVITGHKQEAHEPDGNGIFRWVFKPFRGEALREIVKQALQDDRRV